MKRFKCFAAAAAAAALVVALLIIGRAPSASAQNGGYGQSTTVLLLPPTIVSSTYSNWIVDMHGFLNAGVLDITVGNWQQTNSSLAISLFTSSDGTNFTLDTHAALSTLGTNTITNFVTGAKGTNISTTFVSGFTNNATVTLTTSNAALSELGLPAADMNRYWQIFVQNLGTNSPATVSAVFRARANNN